MQRILALLAVATLLHVSVRTANAAHTEARLVLSAATAKPGDTITAAVHLKMDPGWHTYWKNPGASGQATKIEWLLPTGITAGEIQWPKPEKLVPPKTGDDGNPLPGQFDTDLATYVFHDETALLVPLKLAPDLKTGPVELKAKVSWLECESVCLSGDAEIKTSLEIGSETKPSAETALVDGWRNQLPKPADGIAARAVWEKAASGEMRPLILEWQSATAATEPDFFPDASDEFEVQPEVQVVSAGPEKVRIRKSVKKLSGDWPKQIQGIVVGKVDGKLNGWEVKLPIESGSGKAAATPFSWGALFSALVFAFLGGLILNIMPCVLPVIALKVFSFVKQSGEAPGRARRLSLVYGLGILCSFLVLAAFLITVQQAGHVASWGAQMQNPTFLIGMTILVTLVALNLFGVFEVTLSGGAMSAADSLTRKSGASGAFFNGVLATALAIPCTAPFLTAALAFAFAQPPLIIVLTFSFIAFGLAAPYIVLTWNPALLKFLPKPGAWMQRFKVALGFPMLATVVWLYKLSLNHLNKSQALWFGIFLVTLATAAWIWGEFVQRGTARRWLAAAMSLVLITAAGAYAATRGEGIKWQPWSQAAVEKARAAGRPVLVDFTADWCLTCQLNLRTSIEVPRIRAKLAETKAATLIGDYTRQDETIGKELHRFGRDAVPLVVVFPKNPAAEPIILPPVLRPQMVLDALDKAAR